MAFGVASTINFVSGALSTLTRNAANAHRNDRIRVNGINMGWVATDGEKAMSTSASP